MNTIEYKRNKKWYKEANNLLLNKRIVAIGWHEWDAEDKYSSTGLVFKVEDGTHFFLSCDDEGNDAGALHWQTKKGYGVLPVGVASVNEMKKVGGQHFMKGKGSE